MRLEVWLAQAVSTYVARHKHKMAETDLPSQGLDICDVHNPLLSAGGDTIVHFRGDLALAAVDSLRTGVPVTV